MSLFKEIEPYVDYVHSIRKLKNYFSFDIIFPIKWVIPKSLVDDQMLPFDQKDEHRRGISFVSEFNEESITKTLDKINRIININIEREQKDRLFKQYIEKLKNTFETTNLDKLQSLYFEFQDELPKLDDSYERVESKAVDVELVEETEE